MNTTTDCPACEGTGILFDASCGYCDGTGEVTTIRYCAICGEPEGSTYARPCCTYDQMLEA